MSESNCERVRQRLAADERELVAEHLADCPDCREEARRIAVIVAALARNAALAPPAALDAIVRRGLRAEPFGVLSRPWLAGGVAAAAFSVLVSGIATILSRTTFGEWGPLIALALGAAWLALCSAAALPVMVLAVRSQVPWTRRPS